MSLSHSKCSIKCLSDEDLMAQKFVGENFPFDCKFSAIIHSQSNCYCTQEFPWHFVPVTYQYWKLSISKIRFFFFLLNLCQVSKKYHGPLHYIVHQNIELFDTTYPLSQWWPPTFPMVPSLSGATCLACSVQLGVCHAAADGLRRDVLMAVITLWIVTADQGHNKKLPSWKRC